MSDRFNKAIGNWYMTSFCIENVAEAQESVLAELIDLVSMQDIHPDEGLKEVKFNRFNCAGEIDEGVLD